ncbi:hypothetical protein BH09ACT1_BH09ACT1_28460 [soil metagenome]
MRFVVAIVCFVVAVCMAALGVAQRTLLAEPDNVTASTVVTSTAPVTVISSKTLNSLDGRQTITIEGSGKLFAAYGRTSDVTAWIGTTSYNRIGFSATKPKLTSTLVSGKAKTVPNPADSDLWLDQYTATKTLVLHADVPADISLLIATDGTKAAPNQLSVQWPLDNRTPWSGPLLVGGGVFLLLALGFWLSGVIHLRRQRGPRRKSPTKMPKVPRQRGYRQRKPKAASGSRAASGSSRRSNARRMTVILPVALIGSLALGGCSAELWPEFISGSSTPTPSPTATAATTADVTPPAVTVAQLKIIVSRISTVATKADAESNLELLKTRFEGPAFALREANYAIRKVDSTYAAPAAIPSGDVKLTLPQQSTTWPKTVFTVVQNSADATIPPVALMLVQQTPRDNYKVDYATALEASAVLPKVAPATVGASRLAPDSKLLVFAPANLALAYGDILEKGTTSEYSKSFNITKDTLIGLIGADARKKLQAALPATAAMTFANSNGDSEPIALGSNNSGAIVTAYLNETVTVKPVEAGASVNPEGAVKSLSGITGSTKGTVAVYGDQLLFYVPPAVSANSKVILLGFTTGLVSAKELP